jgi:hypothetical protein
LTLVALHGWLAVHGAGMRAMYADFGGKLPVATRLVISSAWLWGVPVVGFGMVSFLIIRRPQALAVYVGIAVILFVTALATYQLMEAPLTELAGKLAE